MKRFVLALAAFFWVLSAQAQLGKSKAQILAQWPNAQVLKEGQGGQPGYTTLLLGLDSIRYVQLTFKADKAVLLSIMHADSSISEQQYQTYLAENLGAFKPKQRCLLGPKTYLMNAGNTQMVVQNHRDEGGSYPLMGLLMATDPAMIKHLAGRMEGVCR